MKRHLLMRHLITSGRDKSTKNLFLQARRLARSIHEGS
ncbi:MAG: hypothetical protein OJF51_000160 [Nitrospira sp.]|nr:MAG: hypothetical protein OJF51_000160 [Nitrospira sp.]